MDEIKFDGNKLFNIRKEKKLSQAKLASAVGVTRQTIYLWESNQSLPDVEKVSKLCKALDVDLSELVDGIETQKDEENLSEKVEIKEIKKNSKNIKKMFIIVFIVILCSYSLMSIMKSIKLNTILIKWKELKSSDKYYIEVSEYLIDKNHENNEILENRFYEIYYNNSVFKKVFKDSKEEKIVSIIIKDYKAKKRYVIDEKEKTYMIEKIDEREDKYILTENFKDSLKFEKNPFSKFAFCFNPTFNIWEKGDKYNLILGNSLKFDVDKETGIVTYEEITDNALRQTRRYYKVELDTDKDFEVNLDDYTEVE